MSKRLAVRQRLFEQGMRAAAAALGSTDTYFCPLCGAPFEANAICDGKLTLEHVPPKAQGGKEIILTCHRCNNLAGSSIDAEAANRDVLLNFVNVITGRSPGQAGRATPEIGGHRLNVDIRGDESGNKISIDASYNDPAARKASADYMRRLADSGGSDGLSIKITARTRYNYRLAKVSLLKSAFLACVAALGYKFAFAPALRRVRGQIIRPEESILPPWYLRPRQASHAPGIGLSAEHGVVFVALGKSAVILPWPPSGENRFNALSAIAVQGQPFDLKGPQVPWPRSFVAAIDCGLSDR